MTISNQSAKGAEEIIREHGGIVRVSEAISYRIHPRTLYVLRGSGRLEKLDRGLYRLPHLPPPSDPDLTAVAPCIPAGVLCPISALDFHGITSEIPHEITLALLWGFRTPSLESVPLKVFRFSGAAITEGIEEWTIDGFSMRVYSPARTIADCFQFRNKIGLGVAVEGLRFALERKKATPGETHRFAALCES